MAPERWERWQVGFGERHDGVRTARDPDGSLVLIGGDGAQARPLPWSPERAEPEAPPVLAHLLVRRGGYAVGVSAADTLTRHRCGTRYVQSRTAAGGWSQQRFARRRAGQADALVSSVVGHAADVIGPDLGTLRGLVVGGDKTLTAQVLDSEGLRVHLPGLLDLPRRAFHDIPDPRLAVLRTVVQRARALRVQVIDP